MVEVYRDLMIRGGSAGMAALIDQITANLGEGWERDLAREEELNGGSDGSQQFAFRWAGPEPAAATLCLVRRRNRFEVSQIVLTEVRSLSRADYNSLLEVFAYQVVRPIAESLGLSMEISPESQLITYWLSDEAARRLRSFSSCANKSTGSSHHLDMRRWSAFLVRCHQENWPLSSLMLKRWLVEEDGWPDEQAWGLTLEYEFAQNLLTDYDIASQSLHEIRPEDATLQ